MPHWFLSGVRFRIQRADVFLFLLLWLSYAYFYQSSQHNEAARFDQIRALLEDGTLAIDRFAYNSADVVVHVKGGEKHIYPAKAPGPTFVGIVPFALSSFALQPFALPAALHWHLVAYLTTTLTVALLSATSGVVMFRLLSAMTGERRSAALAVIAVWLGSISFPFSTLFFSHQLVAAQLVFVFAILFGLRHAAASTSRTARSAGVLIAGLLAGFSIACEYPATLLVGLLGAYLLLSLWQSQEPLREKLAIVTISVAGLGLGLLVLVIYNVAVFGRLAYTPYHELGTGGGHQMFALHARGLAGVAWPGLGRFVDVLAEITIRPQRGLMYLGFDGWRVFACSPVLWLSVPGLILLARRFTAEAMLCAAMIVTYFTFNACYGDSIVFWGGGASVGPRHLVPLLPFLAIPLAFAVRRLKMLFYPLLMLSVFYMLLATAVEPRTPYRPVNPWQGLYLPSYLDGRFAVADDGLFHPGEKVTHDSTAFNLAKLAGIPGRWQLAPLMLVWLILGAAVLDEAGRLDMTSADIRRRTFQRSVAVLATYTILIAAAPAAIAWSAGTDTAFRDGPETTGQALTRRHEDAKTPEIWSHKSHPPLKVTCGPDLH
jgi:hypothetical protein